MPSHKNRGDPTGADYAEMMEQYKLLTDAQKLWIANRPFHVSDKACAHSIGQGNSTFQVWRIDQDFRNLEQWFLDDPSRVAVARRDLLLLKAEQVCEKILDSGTPAQQTQALKWASEFYYNTQGLVKQHRAQKVRVSKGMFDADEDETKAKRGRKQLNRPGKYIQALARTDEGTPEQGEDKGSEVG